MNGRIRLTPVGGRIAAPIIASILWLVLFAHVSAQSPQDFEDRAEQEFGAGQLTAALADFDRVKAAVPSVAPLMWQRGIALYESGRFDDCAAQFASYHAANPADLESAIWNFLCVARRDSPEQARAALLKGGGDTRVMRAEIYAMLQGRISPADVIGQANESGIPTARFYAHLYVGLYLEALGDRDSALIHLKDAASPEYDSEGGFMNVVAHVHRDALARAIAAARRP